MRYRALFLALFLMTASAQADWIALTPDQLAKQSELIVVAECIGVEHVRLAPDGPLLSLAVLRIDTVLKGDASRKTALLLLPSRPNGLVASTDVPIQKGQHGLWYLKPKSEGLFQIDRPDRFVPMDAARERIRTWKRQAAQ